MQGLIEAAIKAIPGPGLAPGTPLYARLAPGGMGPTQCPSKGGAFFWRCYLYSHTVTTFKLATHYFMYRVAACVWGACLRRPGVFALFATRAKIYREAAALQSHYLSLQLLHNYARSHKKMKKPGKSVEFAGFALIFEIRTFFGVCIRFL